MAGKLSVEGRKFYLEGILASHKNSETHQFLQNLFKYIWSYTWKILLSKKGQN